MKRIPFRTWLLMIVALAFAAIGMMLLFDIAIPNEVMGLFAVAASVYALSLVKDEIP